MSNATATAPKSYPSKARQFAFHKGVSDKPPVSDKTALLDKAFSDDELTREEKDKLGAFSTQHPAYQWLGWQWYMPQAKQLRRILVNIKHYGWQEYYAADKTALRRYFKDTGSQPVEEMIYIEKQGR